MCTANSFISEPLAIVSLIVDRSRILDMSRPDHSWRYFGGPELAVAPRILTADFMTRPESSRPSSPPTWSVTSHLPALTRIAHWRGSA